MLECLHSQLLFCNYIFTLWTYSSSLLALNNVNMLTIPEFLIQTSSLTPPYPTWIFSRQLKTNMLKTKFLISLKSILIIYFISLTVTQTFQLLKPKPLESLIPPFSLTFHIWSSKKYGSLDFKNIMEFDYCLSLPQLLPCFQPPLSCV